MPTTVGLVTGAATDASAVTVVKQVLRSAGVTRFVTASDEEAPPDAPLRVYLGGPAENSASAAALAKLGIAGPEGLDPEGYVLGIGRDSDDNALAVLSGVDATGTFYAAQTLRQLVVPRAGRAWLPGVSVRDWPTVPLRGVIEGFYGAPWSTADRLSQLDFFAATKQNVYVYSPKDDPYLRARWRDAYPSDQLAVIQRLVDRAAADHVQFTYALSPGLSVCYSSDSDEQALVQKFESLWKIGVRSLAIPLDDISYTRWNCAEDKAKWGSGGGAAGQAQAYLLNRVQKDFIDAHPAARRLEMVPTEYYNVTDSPYKTAIRNSLDPRVIVEWTGVGVVPATITADQAKQAEQVFGHDILVWDNYPVNDYVQNRLLLGPYAGREPGMTDHVIGVTANPMIESEPSKIAEFGTAAYLWNAGSYNAEEAWLASLRYLGGPASAALKVFAENSYSSILNSTESPVLSPLISDYWKAYESRSSDLPSRTQALATYFDAMAGVPDDLAKGMDNQAFVTEAEPWIDKTGLYGEAGTAAVDMLSAQAAGDGSKAWKDRLALDDLRGRLSAISQSVAPGVLDPFLQRAVDLSNRWLGVNGGLTAQTSMGTYQSYVPHNMVDGNPNTFFWSNRAAKTGDYVGVDLGSEQTIGDIDVLMAKSNSPQDYIHQGVLEYSADGSSWTPITNVSGQAHVTAKAPSGTKARYVRLRATGNQDTWVVVDEFTVQLPDRTSLTASGSPAATSGSSFAAAVDGDVTTSYRAGATPAQGDALRVALNKTRPVAAVTVLQNPDAAATGELQIKDSDGAWQGVGQVAGGFTEVRTPGAASDAVRIVWKAGTAAPQVYEVVPWYSDGPPVSLKLDPSSLDLEAGGEAVTATVNLGSRRPADTTGTLHVDAPEGWQIRPTSQQVTVYRGTDQAVTVQIKVPDTTAAKTYDVPVTFTGDAGKETATLTVNVHPKVSSTNVAGDGTADASCVEGDGAYPQFDPKYAVDGDPSTRWSSCYDDNAWLQVHLPQSQKIGKVVLRWEASYGKAYTIQTSSDGVSWTDAAAVNDGDGGTDSLYLDSTPSAAYVRMQGVKRALSYGYSLYEMEIYPTA